MPGNPLLCCEPALWAERRQPVEREQVRLLKRATGPIGAYDHHDDRCRPLVQLAAERMPYSGSLPGDNGNFF